MKAVGVGVRKKDAAALLSGKPVYTTDIAPKDCLCVKLLRSPHAHAMIEEIDVSRAQQAAGVACVLTYRDVPQVRFTDSGPASALCGRSGGDRGGANGKAGACGDAADPRALSGAARGARCA